MGQNAKRSRKGGGEWGEGGGFCWGKGKHKGGCCKGGWGDGDEDHGCWGEKGDKGGWCDKGFGKGFDKGKGWGKPPFPGVTLFCGGLPPGVERREVLHIFRQYAGFCGLRVAWRQDHSIAFVTFCTMEQAQFVAEALSGYIFDEEAPPAFQTQLSLELSDQK